QWHQFTIARSLQQCHIRQSVVLDYQPFADIERRSRL
ncbi:hypothetical protein ACZ87_03868, partial [Candidatus Erwinia dacicola]